VCVAEAVPDWRKQQNLMAGHITAREAAPLGHQQPMAMVGAAVADKERLTQEILNTHGEGARRTELLRSLDDIGCPLMVYPNMLAIS
jgi:hypothetical protein